MTEPNVEQLLQAILRVESQLRTNQAAIEQNAREIQLASASNAQAFAKGLQALESTFSMQQIASSERSANELQAVQKSNRIMLVGASCFAALTCLAMGMITFLQWRASRCWTEVTSILQLSPSEVSGTTHALPAPTIAGLRTPSIVHDANARLLGTMETLERRISCLEQGGSPMRRSGSKWDAGNGDADTSPDIVSPPFRVAALLRKGQEKLNENDLDSALKCFEEILSLDPNHGEALVRKGAVLERLHKLNEAFECYEQAISVDRSLTMAYLHKGGLCNRLERFKEALECYEKALQTQHSVHG